MTLVEKFLPLIISNAKVMKTFKINPKLPQQQRQDFAWTIKMLQAKWITLCMDIKKEGRENKIGVEI